MKIISTIILLFFVAIPIVFGFGGQTKMRIDEIYNNTGDNIILKPSNKVGIDYLTGDKIIQSTAEGLLEESTVTTTELGYLSGVTSSVQDQISSKQDSITGTDGDLYYWNSGLSNLTIGTEGQFLKVSSLGFPEWVDLPTAVSVTTKGDLQTYSTQADRLPVGTDGQVLQANSATSTGLEWVDADFYTSPLTTEGDLLYRDATQDTRLPIGTEDQVLTVNASGLPVWADSKGGGGSAGINFVFDPSFEKGDLNPDTDASAVESYQAYTADDKLYAEFNEQYYRAAYTGLTANNTYVRDTFARTDLDGKQGLFSIWIKANAENFELCLRTDDSGFASACDDAYKLNIFGDNTWRKYEIPFVYGAASVEYEIKNASYTGDVTIELDNIYVGTMPDGYIQQVGQAHFVGSLKYEDSNCVWSTTSASYSDFTVDPDCNGTTIGSVLKPDTKIPAVKIPNPRTDGYYQITYNGFLYVGGTSDIECRFSLSSSSAYEDKGHIWVKANSAAADHNRSVHTTNTNFRFTDSSDKTIRVIAKRLVGTDSCLVYGRSTSEISSSFTVHFFPDDTSTIVTQNTELTAKTANEFSALILSDGTVIQENYDWIDGNCVEGANPFPMTCTYKSGLVSNPMNCQATISYGNTSAYIAKINSSTSTAVEFQRSLINGNGDGALNAFLHCSKQGTDVNKSATIVGKFENINSSDIAIVEAYQVASQTLTDSTATPITFDTELFDNYNAYNTSTGEFTCPKVAKFKVSYNVYFQNLDTSSASTQLLDIRSSGVVRKELVRFNDVGINGDKNINGTGIIDCDSTSRVYTFNALCNDIDNTNCNTRAGTLGSVGYSNLSVHEIPDTESIIKNLSQQKTECQTKVLSALTGSTGQIADLTFTGLDTNKNYSFVFKGNSEHINTISGDKYVYINTNDSSLQSDFQRALSTVLRFSHDIHSPKFKPASSTVYVNIVLINAMYLLGGASATLCELPDTYVETTEF